MRRKTNPTQNLTDNKHVKAGITEKRARTFARFVLRRAGYNHVFLLSSRGNEAAGVVDLVAVKKRMDQDNRLDETDIILIQVKGNGKVAEKERSRLIRAIQKVRIQAGVLEYKPGHLPSLEILQESTSTVERSLRQKARANAEMRENHLRNAQIVQIEPLYPGAIRKEVSRRTKPSGQTSLG